MKLGFNLKMVSFLSKEEIAPMSSPESPRRSHFLTTMWRLQTFGEKISNKSLLSQ